MAAAVQVQVDGEDAHRALAKVVDADSSIASHELWPGLYEIQFLTPRVRMGTGLETLLGLIEAQCPGAAAGVAPASLG